MAAPWQREAVQRGLDHYMLHGWRPVHFAGTAVGFWSDDKRLGYGTYTQVTARDPLGQLIGTVRLFTTPADVFKAPVYVEDVPSDLFVLLAPFTKVEPLEAIPALPEFYRVPG